jgi:hypothetical protein
LPNTCYSGYGFLKQNELMKENELRIGNYFIGYSNHLQQWELASFGLLIEGIEVDEIIRGFVPLNQDWLLKFGFEMYEFDNKANQFRFKERLIVYREGFLYDYGTSVKLEYVHTLQNLYFALTGTELAYENETK